MTEKKKTVTSINLGTIINSIIQKRTENFDYSYRVPTHYFGLVPNNPYFVTWDIIVLIGTKILNIIINNSKMEYQSVSNSNTSSFLVSIQLIIKYIECCYL